jgi:hypothetical protein
MIATKDKFYIASVGYQAEGVYREGAMDDECMHRSIVIV